MQDFCLYTTAHKPPAKICSISHVLPPHSRSRPKDDTLYISAPNSPQTAFWHKPLDFSPYSYYNMIMEDRPRFLLILGIAILFPAVVILFSLPTSPQPELPETTTETIQTTVTYPDWTLQIPSIGFTSQMSQIHKQGSQLPVPDGQPGYYIPNDGHIFIVGHNNSIFPRLSEKPSQIIIWLNNRPSTYDLVNAELAPVEDIDMDGLFAFRGVVMMTCAGEKIGDTYSHRLILYYQ